MGEMMPEASWPFGKWTPQFPTPNQLQHLGRPALHGYKIGPNHGSGHQVGPTTRLAPELVCPSFMPFLINPMDGGPWVSIASGPAPLKSPVGPPSDLQIRFIIIWLTWAHNPKHGYSFQRFQSQIWFSWWVCY